MKEMKGSRIDGLTTLGGMSSQDNLLDVKPVTELAFEPFGWIVETTNSGCDANNGTARRHDIHAHPAAEVQA